MYLEGSSACRATGPTSTGSRPRSGPPARAGATVLRTVMLERPALRDVRPAEAFREFADAGAAVAGPGRAGRRPSTACAWPSRTTRTGGPTSWSRSSSGSTASTSASASTPATASRCWKTRWRSSRRWPRGRSRRTSRTWASRNTSDGFLLAEVPLGDGVPRPAAGSSRRSAQARPEIRLNLEMITRDPLKVPCLTEKYWATFADLPGRHLARTLALVRAHAAKHPLPRISGLSPDAEAQGRGRQRPPLPRLRPRGAEPVTTSSAGAVCRGRSGPGLHPARGDRRAGEPEPVPGPVRGRPVLLPQRQLAGLHRRGVLVPRQLRGVPGRRGRGDRRQRRLGRVAPAVRRAATGSRSTCSATPTDRSAPATACRGRWE